MKSHIDILLKPFVKVVTEEINDIRDGFTRKNGEETTGISTKEYYTI